MLDQKRIDQLPAKGAQGRQCASLVLLDESGIAYDICDQDRGQPPLRPYSRHGCLSLRRSAARSSNQATVTTLLDHGSTIAAVSGNFPVKLPAALRSTVFVCKRHLYDDDVYR